MVQVITAYTTEVDEVEDALAEILDQIDLPSLKKNNVGLLTCHFDYTNSGFIEALCKKLPFDIIGMTTMASANEHGFSMYALSLTVLTSDDVVFETAATGILGPENYRERIGAAYGGALKKLSGDPSMILGFFPYLNNLSGAVMVNAFCDVCGDVPLWGSLATNIDINHERCYAFRNNQIDQNGLAMILMHGPVEPEFITISIPKQRIRENRGLITSSDGCVLKEINGLPALKYIESLGVVIMKDASSVTPLMVYYEGSTEPVALGIYIVNDDGSLLCGGEMTKGAMIALGEISAEGIISTAEEGVNRVLSAGKKYGALILPCVSRYVTLAPNQNKELELISAMMEKTMPYMLAYSGGEICPVRDGAGKWQNRFHNYTFSACVFK